MRSAAAISCVCVRKITRRWLHVLQGIDRIGVCAGCFFWGACVGWGGDKKPTKKPDQNGGTKKIREDYSTNLDIRGRDISA